MLKHFVVSFIICSPAKSCLANNFPKLALLCNNLDRLQIFTLTKHSLLYTTSLQVLVLHSLFKQNFQSSQPMPSCLVFLITFANNVDLMLVVNSCSVCVFCKMIFSNKLDLQIYSGWKPTHLTSIFSLWTSVFCRLMVLR